MKIIALLPFVALLAPVLAQEDEPIPVSSNDAFKLGMDKYFEFMNETGDRKLLGL